MILTNIPGVKLTFTRTHQPSHLIPAYLPPGKAATLNPFSPILKAIGSLPDLLGMESNLHHPMWNLMNYLHMHRDPHDMIQLMTKHNLMLRWEIPQHTSQIKTRTEKPPLNFNESPLPAMTWIWPAQPTLLWPIPIFLTIPPSSPSQRFPSI